jgi:CRP-like cAMP-binding protein
MDQILLPSSRLLISLLPEDLDALRPHLQPVDMALGTVLFETGDPIDRVYFPYTGLISLVVSLSTGQMIETGIVGRDSLVGTYSALDGKIAINKAIVQMAGVITVLPVAQLRSLAEASLGFRTTLVRHEQFMLVQAQQSAACNAVHPLEARLSRWLLRCRDLTGSDNLDLTQEFLGQMLGVQRSTVSVVASTLQKAGLIRYRRGHIHIVDAAGLRDAACECYAAVKAHSDRLLGAASA